MIGKFQGRTFLSDEQIEGLAYGLEEIKTYLDNKGIPLVVMFCADKESIYPEYYPRTIIRGPEPIQLDIITEYVRSHTDVDVFNIKDCLVAVKDEYLVFDKNSDDLTHYNEIGAFFAYQELTRHISKYFPDIEPFTLEDVDITYNDRGAYHDIPDVQLKQKIKYQRFDTEYGLMFENDDASLPTILLMRDSYAGNGNYLSTYIPQQFGKTIMIHWSNMANLVEYIETFQPDIVVFESAERELRGFANAIIQVR